MSSMPCKELRVRVAAHGSGMRVFGPDDAIDIQVAERVIGSLRNHDYLAWLMLPIAMRRNLDLRIEGNGSEETVRNAIKLSDIWSRWLPGHFSPVKVSFAETREPESVTCAGDDLCFYSGGIDSTHALLRRHLSGQRQALLTIHGMDYRYADGARFESLVQKTSPFAELVGTERFLVRTNAYEAYRRYQVNPKGSDIGHAFVLAGIGFLFSGMFERAVLAADYRLDQQFAVHPWGTNVVTNPCFDDGRFRLHTECNDVTRAEKGPLLTTCSQALASLTFCVNYRARPHNCGRCQKCVRTKTMFLAATGEVPRLCLDDSLPPDCLSAFDLDQKHQRAFFFDLYASAKRNGTIEAVPGLVARYEAAVAPPKTAGLWRRFRGVLRR